MEEDTTQKVYVRGQCPKNKRNATPAEAAEIRVRKDASTKRLEQDRLKAVAADAETYAAEAEAAAAAAPGAAVAASAASAARQIADRARAAATAAEEAMGDPLVLACVQWISVNGRAVRAVCGTYDPNKPNVANDPTWRKFTSQIFFVFANGTIPAGTPFSVTVWNWPGSLKLGVPDMHVTRDGPFRDFMQPFATGRTKQAEYWRPDRVLNFTVLRDTECLAFALESDEDLKGEFRPRVLINGPDFAFRRHIVLRKQRTGRGKGGPERYVAAQSRQAFDVAYLVLAAAFSSEDDEALREGAAAAPLPQPAPTRGRKRLARRRRPEKSEGGADPGPFAAGANPPSASVPGHPLTLYSGTQAHPQTYAHAADGHGLSPDGNVNWNMHQGAFGGGATSTPPGSQLPRVGSSVALPTWASVYALNPPAPPAGTRASLTMAPRAPPPASAAPRTASAPVCPSASSADARSATPVGLGLTTVTGGLIRSFAAAAPSSRDRLPSSPLPLVPPSTRSRRDVERQRRTIEEAREAAKKAKQAEQRRLRAARRKRAASPPAADVGGYTSSSSDVDLDSSSEGLYSEREAPVPPRPALRPRLHAAAVDLAALQATETPRPPFAFPLELHGLLTDEEEL